MTDRSIRVKSFVEAQLLVPFPVHSIPGETDEITVRPEHGEIWATVRSVHRVPGATVRVKQYAMDWFGFFGAPNKLLFTHGDEHSWGFYGPTSRLKMGHRPAFHGTDFSGSEAGALTSLATNIDVRVLNGSLGSKGMKGLLRRIAPIDSQKSRLLARRPLALWNWSLRGGRLPGLKSGAMETRIRWFPELESGLAVFPRKIEIPKLRGWRFDSIGIYRASAGEQSFCHILYRSTDLHTTLEVGLEVGKRRSGDSFRRPYPPLFAEEAIKFNGGKARYFRSAVLDSAWVTASKARRRLTLVIPPTHSDIDRDKRIVTTFARGLLTVNQTTEPLH